MPETFERYLENVSGKVYTAEHEIVWLEHLPAEERRKQLQLILWNCRRYDASVDLAVLRSECIRLWSSL